MKTVGVITKWYRILNGELEFNHISDGYDPEKEEPSAVSESQRKGWHGVKWVKQEARLVDGVVTDALGSATGPMRWS